MRLTVTAGTAVALALAACGSTVQLRGQALDGGASGPAASDLGGTSGAPVSSGGRSLGINGTSAGSSTSAVAPATGTLTSSTQSAAGATLPTGHAPVVVGIRIPNRNSGAIVGNLTGTKLDTGDPRAMASAVVSWINARGGLAGHPIKAVFYENCAPLSCDLAVQDQAICSSFIDQKAIAMVDSTQTSVALASCLARAGIASLGGGVGAFDSQDLRTAEGLWSPYLLSTDVAFMQLVSRLNAMRWFVAGDKVGLLYDDAPTYQRTAEATKRAMSAIGKSFADEASYSESGSTSQWTGIVLRFQSENIKRIVIVDAGSSALLYFGPAASSQRYFPKVTVTSLDVMGTLALIANPQTLAGAAGVGWIPAADAAPNPPAPNSSVTLCAKIYKQAQVSTSGPLAAAFAATYCDALMLAKTAYDEARAFALPALRSAVASLGGSYRPAATFTDRFGPGTYAGAATTEDVQYDTSCSCFRYTSGPQPLSH